jgi:hypothetical protein
MGTTGHVEQDAVMARQEADRDDLFAEAVSLIRRWEGRMPACSVPVLAGFKAHGETSFYFEPDRVYHYDTEGRLRRAFIDGLLYRSREDTLTRLRRERTESETALLRSDLTSDEVVAFRTDMVAHLGRLRNALRDGVVTTLRRFPEADSKLESDFATVIGTIIDATPWLAPIIVRR